MRQTARWSIGWRVRYTAFWGERGLSVNKKLIYVVIGLAVLCVAYPGCAWLIGLRVEASMAKREQMVKDQFPGTVTLISRQYQRGVFGAAEELTYDVGTSLLRALRPMAAIPNLGPLRVTVRNTIHHGPLPQFRTIGFATLSTDVTLPRELSAKLRQLLGGEPAIQIHSRLGWFGSTTTVVESPSYQGQLADGTQINWHGVEATSTVSQNLSSTSMNGAAAGMGLKSAKFQAEVDGVHVSADWKRAFDVLYTGPFSMKIETVKWQSVPASGPSLVQGVAIGGDSSADGDYFKSAAEFGVDTVQTPRFSVTHAGYAISFEHLHGPTLAAMTKAMRGSAVNAGVAAQPLTPAGMETLKKSGIELLLHEPIISISRMGFAMPEGELRLSATASEPGLKREDIENRDGPQFQAALIEHLNVVADLRIDATLLNRLLADSGRKDAVAAQIASLERQGYIKRDGTALTVHVTFVGGALAVNGKPYLPTPPQ
jgi:uncharacterized protein YdgA (DUF945 family)